MVSLSRRSLLAGVGVSVGVGTLFAGRSGLVGDTSGEVVPKAIVAGSLLRLADRIPEASVEAHGSAAVQRLIRNGLRTPDAVALADPRLFAGISTRATVFATNALVLTYDPDSRYASRLQAEWHTALESTGIRLGRTDPEQDPLGYRTVMALRLAEERYDIDTENVLSNSSRFPETDLLNVVAGGMIDAAFTYRNMAVQRDLPYISLPDTINFANPALAETYRSVSYDLGERTLQGTPIRYAATALTDAGNPWIRRLVTSTTLLQRMGFIVPPHYPQYKQQLHTEQDR